MYARLFPFDFYLWVEISSLRFPVSLPLLLNASLFWIPSNLAVYNTSFEVF